MKPCQRCQQFSKLTSFHGRGGSEELCKACRQQAELQQLHESFESSSLPLSGRVVSNTGGIEGVLVTVQGLDTSAVTDASGCFSLEHAARDAVAQAATQLYASLRGADPDQGCETWFRRALGEGALPKEYGVILRQSNIGAALDRDTFVALLTHPRALGNVSARLLGAQQSGLILSFTKAGFAPCSATINLADSAAGRGTSVEARMQRATCLGSLDATTGGTVRDPLSGASVTLAEGTRLVRRDGSSYDGEAKVTCTVLDVTKPKGVEAMPGDYSCINVDGKAGQLESFGAMYIGLSTPEGETLELHPSSPGMALSFISAATGSFENGEPTPSVYSFDGVSGKWLQKSEVELQIEGVVMPQPGALEPNKVQVLKAPDPPNPRLRKAKAKGRGDEFHKLDHGGFIAEAQVWTPAEFAKLTGRPVPRTIKMDSISKTGYWNCDRIMETCFVSAQVLDSQGRPVTAANVFSVGVHYSGASPRSGLSEAGEFSVLARCISAIKLVVLVPMESSVDATGAATCFGGEPSIGTESERFIFGPIKTGQPGEQLKLGALELTESAKVPAEDALKQRILRVFDEWDVDGKGWINEADLSAVLGRIGLAKENIAAMFRAADTNEDGKVDYDEFLSWICASKDNGKLLLM